MSENTRDRFWIKLVYFGFSSLFVLGLIGCGERKNKNPVAGTVKVDGQPVKKGTIQFVPDAEENNDGPGCTLEVTDGAYESTKYSLVTKGANVVTVIVIVEDEKPAKYTKKVDIPKGGNEQLNFEFSTDEDE